MGWDRNRLATAFMLVLMFAPHVVSVPTIVRTFQAVAEDHEIRAYPASLEPTYASMYAGGTLAHYRPMVWDQRRHAA